MNYHFSKYLLQRVPLFPINHYDGSLQIAIDDSIFQAAIYLASPQFYARLEKAGFNLSKMDMREVITLSRYYNRACFRPTPFGYFASVGMGHWSISGHPPINETADALLAYVQPAEWVLQNIIRRSTRLNLPDELFEANPTLYRVKKYYRFIKEEVGNNNKRTFQLQSSQYSLVLRDLLRYTCKGVSRKMIEKQICKVANCTQEEGLEYFEFLKDAQILLPKYRPGITGIAALIMRQPTLKLPHQLNVISPLLRVNELREIEYELASILNEGSKANEKSLLNTIFVRERDHTLSEHYQKSLKEGFFALDRLCPPDQFPALSRFKENFVRHFEGERIPLLLALDPEFGIGYQAEVQESPNPLLETVNIRPRNSKEEIRSWTAAHQYLMSAWLKMSSRSEGVIELEETALHELKNESMQLSSLGFSALFSINDQHVYIESAGGMNPNALIGRFTLAHPSIYEAAKEMATEIEQLNPEFIFAEVLHLSDPHIDNVNRRAQVWSYQLPLLAGQPYENNLGNQLRLDDLYVEINGNMVLLWSEKNQKYVFPRLTSAYNHSIDPLPLFRFLADLSYQYSRSQISFELSSYFPGFSHYPRVCYRQAVLSPATWIIDMKFLSNNTHEKEWVSSFISYARHNGIPQYFILTEGDQQLVFDQGRNDDLILLRETIQSKKQVTIREYLAPENSESKAQDRYQVQYNAFLLPDFPLVLPKPAIRVATQQHEQRKFIPGTEWLYLKLYIPRLSVNRLLLEIDPLLRKRFPHGKISRWFFIRYEDHAPHIRLRLKISPEDIDLVLGTLRVILEENVHQHLIREYQLDVYSRELERYQAIGMEETEAFFWFSSSFVLQYIKAVKAGSAIPTYLAAAITTKLITDGFYKSPQEQLAFWHQTFEIYLTEFEGKQVKVELDQKYRDTSRTLDHYLKMELPFKEKSLQQWANKLKVKAADLGSALIDEESKKDYLISLIHVHLNRLFTDQARQQEMIIYFLLSKWMRSQVARQKLRPNGQS